MNKREVHVYLILNCSVLRFRWRSSMEKKCAPNVFSKICLQKAMERGNFDAFHCFHNTIMSHFSKCFLYNTDTYLRGKMLFCIRNVYLNGVKKTSRGKSMSKTQISSEGPFYYVHYRFLQIRFNVIYAA